MWRSLAGMVDVELTSADTAAALDEISGRGITVSSVRESGDLTVRFLIHRADLQNLERLAKKRGYRLCLRERKGIYWSTRSLLHRPVLIIGMLILLSAALSIPSRVWFVQVDGNESVPEKLILEAAEESGIRFGASRRTVRSEKVKNELLSALPQLKWAGVNTYGCVAVISVRERSIPQEEGGQNQVCSIVAARDGIIQSCTATKGNLLCAAGQAVKRGEVLISGYTDCGLTICAAQAQGEIMAQTQRDLEAVLPSKYRFRGRERSKTVNFSLIIGKKRINFYKGSGIWDATCGKMYQEYHLILPGGFELPVTLVKEVQTSCELSERVQEQRIAEKQLCGFTEDYLRQTMVAGEIINADCMVTHEDGVSILTGEYSCVEMIGRVRYEKIGDYNGKTD